MALGGSLTMGRGASAFGRTDWVALVGSWLRGAFPGANHSMLNSAIPASPSEYISFCLQHYLPPQPDLVLVSSAAAVRLPLSVPLPLPLPQAQMGSVALWRNTAHLHFPLPLTAWLCNGS